MQSVEESYRIELIRKSIHFSSILIPIFYFYTPREFALSVLLPMTAAFLIVDIARYYHRPTELWFNRIFGWLLRSHESDRERKHLNGATYVLIAAALAVLVFPKIIAVTSFIILIISDLTAALVGKRFGKHRLFKKSWEGTLAFFLSAILVIAFLPKVEYRESEYLVGILAAAAGAIIEVLPIDIDDNLSIPFTVGFVLWGCYSLFLPTINVYKFG
ncbi:MAG: dolichol kinase [Ignavibacteriae bacterium]|nr:dolichol kinase [Ignavibacteria bacterium]MBI3364814.1 dolichol kinase [Ignavibacteriota bacterium]